MTHNPSQRDEAVASAREDIETYDSKIETLVISGTKQLRYARALLDAMKENERLRSVGHPECLAIREERDKLREENARLVAAHLAGLEDGVKNK